MTDNYTYPAILDFNEEGYINIIFPDFENGMTCVEKNESFIEAAQDLLVLLIMDMEEKGNKLSKTSKLVPVINEGQQLVYINVWMPYHRTKIKEVYVKKTLTIPMWLDIIAKENNINFSATLVNALKEKLDLKNN